MSILKKKKERKKSFITSTLGLNLKTLIGYFSSLFEIFLGPSSLLGLEVEAQPPWTLARLRFSLIDSLSHFLINYYFPLKKNER